jgi:peptidoglycan/LPS O-acetylase OafA/YrhL
LQAAARDLASHQAVRSAALRDTVAPALSRIDALTGIRAVAALWVVAFHFAKTSLTPLHLEQAVPALSYGYLGVDLFFVLSGFIISHVHQRDALSLRSVLRFYGLRIARMYPVHLLTLCGLLIVVLVGPRIGFAMSHPEDFRAADFVYNLLLVHAWGASDDIHWNSPAWSISCEWFVYLLFPLLALGLNRVTSKRQAVFWIGLETAIFALAYVFFFHCNLDNKFDGGNFSQFALARVCLEFTVGTLCYTVIGFINMRAWAWTAIVLAAILGAVLLATTPARDFAIVVVFVLTILASSMPGNLVARFLSLPLLVYLGEISYSLYMVHSPVRMTLGKLVEPRLVGASTAGAWAMGLGFCLATLATAAAVYHVVEVPARRWLRRQLLERVADPDRSPRRSPAPGPERSSSRGGDTGGGSGRDEFMPAPTAHSR